MKKVKNTLVGLCVLGSASAFAADWYAKDNLQPGHDPTMIRYEDGYALMTTNNQLSLWTSEDAYNWKAHGKTMTKFPQWIYTYAPSMEDVWAPDLYVMNGEFRAYYCGSVFGKRTSAIGYTASKSIVPGTEGYGWQDRGHVFHTVATDKYNAIDPDVIKTSKGEFWMAFGSFGLGIQLIKLDPTTGLQANDDKTVYNIARRTSSASGGAEEGPSLIEHNGQYFLFTAWDKCCQQGANIEQTTYKTAYGRADQITGPYKDRAGYNMATGGGTIVLERYGRYVGPGGGEPFQDLNRVRFVHHYYDNAGDKYNHIHIRDIVFTDDNWAEMGQPFLGRYLSAEAEHGVMTRAVSGDLAVTRGTKASGNEYVGYVNTKGSNIHLPMNIMQAGDYLLRYRYANGGTGVATHSVTVNGKAQEVKLPATGAWGEFPETSVVMIPAKLKRGGNFIDVSPVPNGENFAELDRIDFLRIIRDTIPGNGFDNGIRIRLNEKDELAMKDGGYALFENVVTDSIKSTVVSIQVKNGSGKLALRAGSKSGAVLSECDLSAAKADENGWSVAECSEMKAQKGVQDFFLTASGVSGEVFVGNIMFKAPKPVEPESSSSEEVDSSSSEEAESSNSECNPDVDECSGTAIHTAVMPRSARYTVTRMGDAYSVQLNSTSFHQVYLLNSMGQIVAVRNVRGAMAGSEVRFENLPKGNFIVKVK
ncbi:MAG: family 43 glycosylhydrolase [Fibrobacter sp.]|nr:family 43 glycosylhydrolase [Fibrobacter sp.]